MPLENCDRLKARPLVPVSQVVNAKEKFLKEIESAAPVNTGAVAKPSGLITDMEEVLAVWREDQTRHDIP